MRVSSHRTLRLAYGKGAGTTTMWSLRRCKWVQQILYIVNERRTAGT
jgi:hypothetical protein